MSGLAADRVILVDTDDVAIGHADKLCVHREGWLHRAFSVFVANARGEVLLQKRAASKYHSGGLWSNTCCSHPRPGETTHDAALRRIREEMGFACAIRPCFSFLYRAELDGGMIEHEYDYVFTGRFDGVPRPDPQEVADWRWVRPQRIDREIRAAPQRFTCWFRIAWRMLGARGANAAGT